MGLFLIVAIVIINFYIKKDLYLSTIIGLVLLNIYLMIYYDVTLVSTSQFIDFKLLLDIAILTCMMLVFKKINDITSFTSTKDDIRNMLDTVLKDKKLKLVTIFLLGVFFSLSPFLGVIYLIFIAIFFRISKYNLIIVPIVSVLLFDVLRYLLTFDQIYADKFIAFKFLILMYSILTMFLMLEKIRKFDIVVVKELLLDLIFMVICLVINIYVYIIANYLYSLKIAIFISLLITWILSIIVLNKFSFFVNKDYKERKREKYKSYLAKMRLPYLTIVSIFLLEILGFLLFHINFEIGGIYIIILNLLFIKNFNSKNEYKKIDYSKVVVFIIVIYVTIFILQSALEHSMEEVLSKLNNEVLYLGDPLNFLLNSLNLILLPNTGIIENQFTSEVIRTTTNLKILLMLKVQMSFSIINLFILSQVFSLKKEEVLYIITTVLVTSIMLQFIIYLY